MADKPYDELLPPESDKRIGPRVYEILGHILDWRNSMGLPAKWTLFYNLRRNNQWNNKKLNRSELVDVNLLHPHHTRAVNMLTDRNPTFEVRQNGKIDNPEGMNALKNASASWFRDTGQKRIYRETVDTGETYGTGIEKVIWNQDLNKKKGEVETISIEPFFFGVYPPQSKTTQAGSANAHFYPMDVAEAKRKWPDFANKIRSDEDVLKDIGDEREESVKSGKKSMWTTISSSVKEIVNFAGGSDETGSKTVVIEMWAKDYSKDEDGIDKYPGNIRRVTVLSCGNVVVEDSPNPSINPGLSPEVTVETYLWDKFPFSKAQSIMNTLTFHGDSDFEQLRGLQKEFVKSVNQFKFQKDRGARGKLKNPETSGVRNEEFTNTTSIINPVNAEEAQGIGWMEGPKDYNDLLQGISFFKDFFWEISGKFGDLGQADQGKGVIAFKAIEALIEQASIMEKGKIEEYTDLLTERGRMYIGHAQNWYTNERYISWDQDGDEQVEVITGKDLLMPATLYVVPGSTLPVSRIAQREEAVIMYDKGLIDQKAALQKMEEPNADDIIRRMQAGPIGEALELLKSVGVPEELVEYFSEIMNSDPKQLEKAVKDGDVPDFMEALIAIMSEEPPEDAAQKAEEEKTKAETEKIRAETNKINAEADLAREKIETEKVEQERIANGVDFDSEKLRIERAKTTSDIKNKAAETNIKATDAVKSGKDSGPYSEKGLKSNNEKKEK